MIAGISPQELQERFRAERVLIRKFQILYGRWWPHYALPHELKWTLYAEFDTCPYCSALLLIVADSPARDHAVRHIDHMDPLSRGGEESFRNAICACAQCNMAKGRLLFADWLKKLPETNQVIARSAYLQKLGRTPEEFRPGAKQQRMLRPRVDLAFDENVLRTLYPKPVVDGPPKRR